MDAAALLAVEAGHPVQVIASSVMSTTSRRPQPCRGHATAARQRPTPLLLLAWVLPCACSLRASMGVLLLVHTLLCSGPTLSV